NIKSSENLEKFKDIPEEEKNELKHELEDIIIDKLTEFLAQLDLTKEEDFQKVELLLKLNKMILERFIKIESENEEASSKEKNS
ncbi:MAG: hypothetical protein JW984_01010, partial [Deltaproteobacteria bacterium]|nr:hypothetical protein [Candidatus Zymogenus saltonus]